MLGESLTLVEKVWCICRGKAESWVVFVIEDANPDALKLPNVVGWKRSVNLSDERQSTEPFRRGTITKTTPKPPS